MAEQQQKEFGKLTAEQFKRLISHIPEVSKQRHELNDAIKSCSEEKLDELLGKDFQWASFYELPFIEHVAWLIVILGKVDWLKDAAAAPDPQQVVLDELDKPDDGAEWDGGAGGVFDKRDLTALAISIQRTILSILIFQRSLSGLVEEVRQGNVDSLFDAVRLDRSIVACPTIAAKIAKAEMTDDKNFFLRLKKALKGPSKKHWEGYRNLRYSLYVLRELGFDKLSDEQLERLLVDQLKVYPNNFNARRNLRKQYRESKKFSTT